MLSFYAMDRTLDLVKGMGNGKGVAKRLFIDLNQRPEEHETNDQPKVKFIKLWSTINDQPVSRAL